MTLEPSCAHGTTPRQGGLDSLTCAIIFDESPRKPAEDVKLWNCTIPQNKEASKNMSGTNTINTWRKLQKCNYPGLDYTSNAALRMFLMCFIASQKRYHDKKIKQKKNPPAVHGLWMNKQLLTQKCSWVQERGMFPVWMVIHVKGNHKMTMFPLSRFSVEAACAHKQTGNMQTSGQKKGVLRN